MDKQEIYLKLVEQHQELKTYVSNLSDTALLQQKEGKWSALQNIDHLLKSLQIVNRAVRKPAFLLRRLFGKPNRAARTYDELVQRYREKSAQATIPPPERFAARQATALHREEVLRQYDKEAQKFFKFVKRVKDAKLDGTLVPHPLLGKLILRELLYFMHFHTGHHLEAIKKSASLKQ